MNHNVPPDINKLVRQCGVMILSDNSTKVELLNNEAIRIPHLILPRQIPNGFLLLLI